MKNTQKTKKRQIKALFIGLLAALELFSGQSAFIFGFIGASEVKTLMQRAATAVTLRRGDVFKDEPAGQKYTVKEGDNLTIIARNFNVLEKHLIEENDLGSNTKIAAGQVLTVSDIDWQSYEGVASWYGPGFHGKVMANGKKYDQHALSVAHRTLPLGTMVKITNLQNGKIIIAPVLDRGPYISKDGIYTRDIDLSYAAAKELNIVGRGLAEVKIERISDSEKTDSATVANAGKEVRG